MAKIAKAMKEDMAKLNEYNKREAYLADIGYYKTAKGTYKNMHMPCEPELTLEDAYNLERKGENNNEK